jgi:xanthine dehydrogenase large subunit
MDIRATACSDPQPATTEAVTHESAHLHVTGRAEYTDDIPLPDGALHAAVGISTIAHGRIRALDVTGVVEAPQVVAIALPADIPGENNYSTVRQDDPIFADGTVEYAGQPLFAVAARSYRSARLAARLARVDCEILPAVLDVRAALAAESYIIPSERVVRGEPLEVLARAPHRLRGTLSIGGQDHFYLEGQIAVAIPQEEDAMLVLCSTQHPSEVQHIVAHALALRAADVTVRCRRMGGGFGGKETQPALIAAIAAVLARKTRCAVKLRLDRDTDMLMTGKRHDFLAEYEVGFDAHGRILALRVMLASRCGYSTDLSGPVNDRALFHIDNAYYLEHLEIISHRCKTHTVSNTAFRGFGAPQAMMVIEHVLDQVARNLRLDPLAVRHANLYDDGDRNTTHYGQAVDGGLLAGMVDRLARECEYRERRAAIASWNVANPLIKRGLALTPVKFGISFTATVFNQAGALLHVYTDGTVLLNHGGTEMGQGLFTKVAQVVAGELGLPMTAVRVSTTDTSKVPNTSATAASASSDLNGKAAQSAARIIRDRLCQFACERYGTDARKIVFRDGRVYVDGRTLSFAELVQQAYRARIHLSATGFYRTPKIGWDKEAKQGRPFFYFAYGVAASEVAVDVLTGETQLLRVDILHDAGNSLNTAIDIGQIEGGYLQGVGWLTSEELWWSPVGELMTHAPSTYKIPSARDWPAQSSIRLLEHEPNREDTIHRSKAVGEPPLMLAISAFQAIRDAVASCAPPGTMPNLSAPATPEEVLRAIAGVLGENPAGDAAPGEALGYR